MCGFSGPGGSFFLTAPSVPKKLSSPKSEPFVSVVVTSQSGAGDSTSDGRATRGGVGGIGGMVPIPNAGDGNDKRSSYRGEHSPYSTYPPSTDVLLTTSGA